MEPREDVHNAVAGAHRPTNSQQRPKREPELAQMITKCLSLSARSVRGRANDANSDARQRQLLSDSWDCSTTVTSEKTSPIPPITLTSSLDGMYGDIFASLSTRTAGSETQQLGPFEGSHERGN
jgi:hypothetical protein